MRKLGVVLLGVGACLIVLGPMLRFYVVPRLAVAPKDQNTVTTLVGPNATIFDVSSLKEITTDLTTKVHTVGDVDAADQHGDNVVVWNDATSTRSSDGVIRSRSKDRVAFDATTAMAVNCCGEFIEDTKGVKDHVKHQGLLVKFPFFTEQKTYPFWDGTLRKSVPIKYVDTEEIQGLSVYKFEQTIAPTSTGSTEVPRSVLGVTGQGNVKAQQMYSNHRTLWVEPTTGVIIKRTEAQDSTLNYQGEPRVTTTKVTTGYDDATVKDNVDTYGPQATQLWLIHSLLDWLLPVIGVILIIAGFLLIRLRRNTARPERADHLADLLE